MDKEERRLKRQAARRKKEELEGGNVGALIENEYDTDRQVVQRLMKNEDELLNFVAKVNQVYEENLRKPAPFMTFVICGMQSAGKSTVMERFMKAVLNIVQEGTGTRCPLDTTCIHTESCNEPRCRLSGEELDDAGEELSMSEVFKRIMKHNLKLRDEDRFSTKPLFLVYRSKHVQNMRFVDTPGIISNKSTGKDNREEIKMILTKTMSKPNTKLCVLLEPKEFATNPVVDFLDSTFGSKEAWVEKSICLMTKFDKNLDDSRTGSKANNFFKEFHDNKLFPHLVITPTLAKENLKPEELFSQRQELLDSSNAYEDEKFKSWLKGHAIFLEQDPDDELLMDEVKERIGFPTAKRVMREIMLEDTAKRLPEVLKSLKSELGNCQKEYDVLKEKERFNNPSQLKDVVSAALSLIERRIGDYMDGDLESSMKFVDKLQTLEDELEAEEDSEWSTRDLNHHTVNEDEWRDRIADLAGEYPKEIQAERKFLGGKQYQRAIEFFKIVMIDALPDPYELRENVACGTGYLGGGLERENWERAMVQITKYTIKKISHPGINFLIKHAGLIFRRLFKVAIEEMKQGGKISATFKLLPDKIERHLNARFDEVLWRLMKRAADKTHDCLEPMYSSINPNLPTFLSDTTDVDTEDDLYVKDPDGNFVPKQKKKEQFEENLITKLKSRLQANFVLTSDTAKKLLRDDNVVRANTKKKFMPDERTAMITEDETQKVIKRSFQYIVSLMEFNMFVLRFHLNHYLYEGFKEEMRTNFTISIITTTDWNELTEPDASVRKRMLELEEKIRGLNESLQIVHTMQQRSSM